MINLGDYSTGQTVNLMFTTHQTDGAPVAPSTAFEIADVRIYKDDSATQRTSSNGMTMTSPFDSVTGLHQVKIDLSDNTDAGFYAASHDYFVVLLPDETVDSVAVTNVIAMFSIQNRAASASGTPPTAATIADAVWDEARAGHVGAGSFGEGVASVQGAVTGAVASVTGNVGGNVTGTVASVVGNVGGNVTGSIGSLGATAKSDVNAEVLDVLNVDTFAEPGQEAPGATVSLVKKIGYLYKFLRNKKTQTSTTLSIYADDATTVDQKSTVADDGSTFTQGEVASGP